MATLAFLAFFVCTGCATAKPIEKPNEKPDATTAGVMAVLTMQREAWNKGDIEKFLSGYVKSEEVTFISGGSPTRGYNAVHERYIARYGKSRETMGTLTFDQIKVTQLGPRNALSTGHWQVARKNQSTLSGMFSLILVQTPEGWRILHDHTSLKETK